MPEMPATGGVERRLGCNGQERSSGGRRRPSPNVEISSVNCRGRNSGGVPTPTTVLAKAREPKLSIQANARVVWFDDTGRSWSSSRPLSGRSWHSVSPLGSSCTTERRSRCDRRPERLAAGQSSGGDAAALIDAGGG